MPERIRVAIVNEGAAGGLRRHLLELCKNIDRSQFEITVVLSRRKQYEGEGNFADVLRGIGIACLEVPMQREISPLEDLRSLRLLQDVLHPEKFDLVHAHAAKAGFLARYACRNSLPCIYTPHGFAGMRSAAPLQAALYRSVERSAVPWTSAFILTSQAERTLVLELGADPARAIVIRNAVQLPLPVSVSPVEVRARLSTPEKQLVFLTVGRLVSYKGVHVLIHAFAGAIHNGMDAELWLAGEGEQLAVLQALAREYQVTERIRFLGFREDIPELLAASDCFVLASQSEGSPYTVLKALALQKPVIATLVPGTEELLSGFPGSRLVRWNDRNALQQAMQEFARQPFPGVAPVSLPQECFDLPGQVRKIEDVYRNVVMSVPL